MRQHISLHDFAASASLDDVATHIARSLDFANPSRASRLARAFAEQRPASEARALASRLRTRDDSKRVAARMERYIH